MENDNDLALNLLEDIQHLSFTAVSLQTTSFASGYDFCLLVKMNAEFGFP